MNNHKEWVRAATGDSLRGVARKLGINEGNFPGQVAKGLDADRVIQISYAYGLDPVRALQDTGHLHFSSSGKTIDSLLDQVLSLAEEAKRIAESEDDDGNQSAA